jgi:hypothetical protein
MPYLFVRTAIVFALLWCFIPIKANAQTHVKGNCAFWLLAMPNISVETRLNDHFTLSGEVLYSPWKSVNGNALQFLQFNPDVRWYPKGSFNGFYFGFYGALQDFKITKWNYLNTGRYQDGWGYGFGGMVGYQALQSGQWALDVYAGAGWHLGKYRGYYTKTNDMYVDWNESGEWLPYRLGIAVSYRIR